MTMASSFEVPLSVERRHGLVVAGLDGSNGVRGPNLGGCGVPGGLGFAHTDIEDRIDRPPGSVGVPRSANALAREAGSLQHSRGGVIANVGV
jgi:hypothetical protein